LPRRRVAPGAEKPSKKEEGGYYEAYVGFARTLRLWFIAYGVGGPALFLTHETAGARLLASGSGRPVAYFFLAGVVLQILVALLFKSAMWYLYLGEFDDRVKSWRLYRTSDWLSESYAIEFVCDLVTLVLFAGATLRLLRIFI
jgi:hypothetical protein